MPPCRHPPDHEGMRHDDAGDRHKWALAGRAITCCLIGARASGGSRRTSGRRRPLPIEIVEKLNLVTNRSSTGSATLRLLRELRQQPGR
jgi:hypothetical protein